MTLPLYLLSDIGLPKEAAGTIAKTTKNHHNFLPCVQSLPLSGDLHEGQPQNVPSPDCGAHPSRNLQVRAVLHDSHARIARMWARSSSLPTGRSVNRKVKNLSDLRPSFVCSTSKSSTKETCCAFPSPTPECAVGSERRLNTLSLAAHFFKFLTISRGQL